MLLFCCVVMSHPCHTSAPVVTQSSKVKSLSLPSLTESVGHLFLLKMASVSDFVPVRRELIKSTPPKPFLIGVAGGSASGKVKVT